MPEAPARSMLVLSGVITLLVGLASVAGLVDARVYAQETQNWAIQARGQDLGNLLAVIVLAVAVLRYVSGSRRAGLVWLGTLLYLVYAYIVYSFAVHFNSMFLVYVTVLGLSAWSVIFGVDRLRRAGLRYPRGRRRLAAGWVITTTGALFGVLWLSELLPAQLAGATPASVVLAGVLVNPIHVIDLSMVLPGFILCGVAALRGREFGLFWLTPWLVFSALMGTSIVAAMILMMIDGDPAAVVPLVLVAILVAASLFGVTAYFNAITTTPG